MSSGNGYDYGMPVHPVCDMFPLMTRLELEALTDDITAHGLMNPVVVHHGQLVDGRNRVFACREAGISPRKVEWRDIYQGDEPLPRWIWSINAERRHLTEDQYVQAQVAITAYEEREAAKVRQSAGGKAAGNHRPKVVTERSEPKKREPAVRTKIAKQLGVSERKVQQALTVQKKPELAKEVIQGKIKLHEAAKQVATPSTKPTKPTHVLPVNQCTNCQRITAQLRDVVREFNQRREDLQIRPEQRHKSSRWRNNASIDKQLVNLCDYIEQQLDLIAADPAQRVINKRQHRHEERPCSKCNSSTVGGRVNF